MKSSDVEPLMKAVGSVLRELRDAQNKHIAGVYTELIGRNDKQAQRLSALEKHVAALERRLPKG